MFGHGKQTSARRAQWGHDRRPMPGTPIVPPVSSARVTVGRALVVGTVMAWLAYLATWLNEQFIRHAHHTARGRVEAFVYLITVTLLAASALSYLTCRLGFFYRAREHRRLPRAALESFFSQATPSVTVIIPSYKEDVRIIRTTMLSAALQDYPELRVVLLIDDPANPTNRKDRRLLEQARAVALQLQDLLNEPSERFTQAMGAFSLGGEGAQVTPIEVETAAAEYDFAAEWMTSLALDAEMVDHTDDFFVEQVLRRLASDFAATGNALRGALQDGAVLPRTRLMELYRRLCWTFRAELSSFERKQYVSLSHEANKAMNLNSYIGLMGGAYRDTMTVSGRELVPTRHGLGNWEIPAPDYVLTLDADSLLLPEYCLRLVHLMEQSEHADVAVSQTPYSAFPGSSTRLERIAGATTDLQFIAHQGMTYYGGTFWVGANAVLRKRALDDICESTFVGSWEIRRYIQDRTVIEDTESTIDMREKGWSLLNYPERLAYSATPPDFGSLCIQRRRWANGGVLILPKLWRTRRSRKARGEINRIAETFIRVNYMGSIAWSSASLILLLVYPFDRALISPLLGVIALPYFIGMASDLKYCGYKRTDVLRIYGFNLILMPVNLAGFCNSLVQALTAEKSVFGRTPKVANRTVPDFLFVISPYLVASLAGWTLWQDWTFHRWVNLGYAAINTALACYAIIAFIGLRISVADVYTHCKSWLMVPVTPAAQAKQATASTTITTNAKPDWASVLHFGGSDESATAARSGRSVAIPNQRIHATARGWVFAQRGATGDDVQFLTDFRPVVELATRQVVGRDAETRLDSDPYPHPRMAEETRSSSSVELEILLARASVQAAAEFPNDEWLGLNVSLALVRAGRALQVTVTRARRPIVLELDARLLVDLPDLGWLRTEIPTGARLAVTAVEPNHETLRLVRQLRPAIVKLDRGWASTLGRDKASRSMAKALVELADETGSCLVADGIDTEAALAILGDIGVRFGQGYQLERPLAAPSA